MTKSTISNNQQKRFIRVREVLQKTGIGRTTLHRLRIEGTFPQAVSISENSIAFVESEVEAWMSERMAARSRAK